tara:strand:- start:1109 stop:1594 length:486 start_codon:yes stop_codon:yes gene_type:complete
MAEITATLNVTSDITDYGLSINKTMTLTKAGTKVGLERTSGVQRVHLENLNHVDLIKGALAGSAVADMTVTGDTAAKVYIKYLESDTSKFLRIGLGNAAGGTTQTVNNADQTFFEIGRLYGNEWMIIPWNGASNVGDITVQPSSASVSDGAAIVEYIVFYQ